MQHFFGDDDDNDRRPIPSEPPPPIEEITASLRVVQRLAGTLSADNPNTAGLVVAIEGALARAEHYAKQPPPRVRR